MKPPVPSLVRTPGCRCESTQLPFPVDLRPVQRETDIHADVHLRTLLIVCAAKHNRRGAKVALTPSLLGGAFNDYGKTSNCYHVYLVTRSELLSGSQSSHALSGPDVLMNLKL